MEQEKGFNPQQTQTKKSMPIVGKAILIYISSVILGLIVNGPLGKLYRYLEGPYHGVNVGVIFDEEVSNFLGGSIFGYFLFLGLLVGLFVSSFKKTFIVWIIGIAYFIFAVILSGSWNYFAYCVTFSILGFLLGKLILEIYKKAKKK